ncbi:15034_t:CDS:2, partial [Entrophospora sp. SA101]
MNVLKSITKYWRRKPDKKCRIGDLEGLVHKSEEKCQSLSIIGMKVDICKLYGHNEERPSKCIGEYEGNSGYVEISKSQCVGGVDWTKKIKKKCESTE